MAPRLLYKILDQPPPDPLPDTLPSTDLDKHDGFIHLSAAEQTPITAKLFFGAHTALWILVLETKALDGRIEYSTDPKAGVHNGCAHVHDSRVGLGSGNVVKVVKAERREGEDWSQVDSMRSLLNDS